MSTSPVPQHVGIILDGNRRWAKKRGLAIALGHERGVENIERVGEAGIKRGVRFLTVYAFSTENWQRTGEVPHLMAIFERFAREKKQWALQHKVRVRTMGQFDRLPASLQEALSELMEATKDFRDLTFSICLSYGGRNEIIRAVHRLADQGIAGNKVTEVALAGVLDSADIPDPDLIIRTAGEQRLSNFLTWQSAYAELYFTGTFWPDFDEAELDAALEWYANRERRYGK